VDQEVRPGAAAGSAGVQRHGPGGLFEERGEPVTGRVDRPRLEPGQVVSPAGGHRARRDRDGDVQRCRQDVAGADRLPGRHRRDAHQMPVVGRRGGAEVVEGDVGCAHLGEQGAERAGRVEVPGSRVAVVGGRGGQVGLDVGGEGGERPGVGGVQQDRVQVGVPADDLFGVRHLAAAVPSTYT
jgi:hypothetical protein